MYVLHLTDLCVRDSSAVPVSNAPLLLTSIFSSPSALFLLPFIISSLLHTDPCHLHPQIISFFIFSHSLLLSPPPLSPLSLPLGATIGYGDLYPTTVAGRALACLCAFLGKGDCLPQYD